MVAKDPVYRFNGKKMTNNAKITTVWARFGLVPSLTSKCVVRVIAYCHGNSNCRQGKHRVCGFDANKCIMMYVYTEHNTVAFK